MYCALIVDDEFLSRRAIRMLGCWKEIQVDRLYEASSVDEAVKAIEEYSPDIIVTDMNMPEKSGVELLQSISRENYDPFVLVISGYTDFEYTHQAIVSRVQNYLLKPVSPTELNRNLQEAFNRLESRRADTAEIFPEENEPSVTGKIYQYVSQNYAENITLDLLAGQFYVSKEHISRSFKKRYGITLFEYLNNYRLDCVCHLLAGSHLSLEEISIRCGFNCSNYLRKVFKRRYGITPSEYRQQAGKQTKGSI